MKNEKLNNNQQLTQRSLGCKILAYVKHMLSICWAGLRQGVSDLRIDVSGLRLGCVSEATRTTRLDKHDSVTGEIRDDSLSIISLHESPTIARRYPVMLRRLAASLLLLFVVGIGNVWGGTSITVYTYGAYFTTSGGWDYANSSMKVSVRLGYNDWIDNATMTKTDYTYLGFPVYSYTFTEKNGGAEIYFKNFVSDTERESYHAMSGDWMSTSDLNGKMYLGWSAGKHNWVTYATNMYPIYLDLAQFSDGDNNWTTSSAVFDMQVDSEDAVGGVWIKDKLYAFSCTKASPSKLKFMRLKSDRSTTWNTTSQVNYNSSYNTYKITGWTTVTCANDNINLVNKTTRVYYDKSQLAIDKDGNSDLTYKYFVIGRDNFGSYSKSYNATQVISNTKLIYYELSSDVWRDATYYGFIGSGSSYGDGSWGSSNLSSATKYTAAYKSQFDLKEGQISLFVPAASSNGATITPTDKGTVASDMNNTQTVVYALSTDGGTTFSTMSSGTVPGKLEISAYKFADGTYNSVSNSKNKVTISAASTETYSASVRAAYTGETTLDKTASSGYEFIGWYDAVNGGNAVTLTDNKYYPISDSTIYARYKTKTWSITYKDNGNTAFSGAHVPEAVANHTYLAETSLNKACKSGYVFDGWYKESNCSGTVKTSIGATEFTSAPTLYAKWSAMSLTTLANNTLYKAEDMVVDGLTITTTKTMRAGVSQNKKFNLLGSKKTNTDADGPMGAQDVTSGSADATFADATFANTLLFNGDAQSAGASGTTLPTSRAIQFVVPATGTLDIYCTHPNKIYLIKDGSSTEVIGSTTGNQKISKEVTAGSYYIYASNSSSGAKLFGLKFRPTFAVTAAVNNGSYGSASAGASWLYQGGTTTITASPNTGYQVTNWAVSGSGATIDPSGTSNATSTTLTMGTANATVTATLAEIMHTVTVAKNDNDGGTISTTSVSVGFATASGTITATANPGYYFTGWTIPDGVTVASGSGTNSITINATADGKTITANFSPIWTVSGSMDDPWETTLHRITNITASAGVMVSGYVDITLAANTDYEFKVVNLQTNVWWGSEVSNNGITYANKATAKELVSGGANNQKIRTATAGTYRFTWDVSNSEVTVTYPAVTPYTISVSHGWKNPDGTFGATTAPGDAHGGTITSAVASVTGSLAVSGMDTKYVGSGENVVFTHSNPNTGYSFLGWGSTFNNGNNPPTYTAYTHNGSTIVINDGSKTLTLNNITSSKSVYAYFKENVTTVTVNAKAGQTGMGQLKFSSTDKDWGSTANVGVTTGQSMTADGSNYGYKLKAWTLSGGATLASGALTDKTITVKGNGTDGSTGTATAEFEYGYVIRGGLYDDSDNGGLPGWDATDSYIVPTGVGTTGTYTATLNRGKKYKLKVVRLEDNYWIGYSTEAVQWVDGDTKTLVGGGYNIEFTAGASGTYTFNYNFSTKALTIIYPTPLSVTYHGNGSTGGSVPTDATPYASGETVTVLGNTGTLVKTGYTFSGWNTTANISGDQYAATGTFTISDNTDLYAKWTQTVTLDRNQKPLGIVDGSTEVTMTYNSNTLTGYTAPTQVGYSFAGYWTSETNNNGDGTMVIDDTGVLQANVDGYTGAGGVWIRTTTPTTLYAKWSNIFYRITFRHNGHGTITVDEETVENGGTAIVYHLITRPLVATPNAEYHFTGWTVSGEDANQVVIGDASAASTTIRSTSGQATVTANFAPDTYTLSYNLDGGSVASPNPTSYTIESSAITLNNPTRDGYNFAGWTGTDLASATMTVTIAAGSTGNRSYTATWTEKPLNSISLSPASATVYVGQYADFTVSYDPSDYLHKGYAYVTTPNYVTKLNTSTNVLLKLQGGKSGGPSSTQTETVSIQSSRDNTKTASVTITVKPLPKVHFTDLVHGESFADLLATIEANAFVKDQSMPTHANWTTPNANTCESNHLVLKGWIDITWPAATAYLNGTGDKPTKSAITGATGYYYAQGGTIDVDANDGKTYYAVWGNAGDDDYVFSCSDLELTPVLVTASTPIFITSTAGDKWVRSPDSILVSGSGLSVSQTVSFALSDPSLSDIFRVRKKDFTELTTNASGGFDADTYVYIFYKPTATTDGLDKLTGITASVGASKPKTITLSQNIIGRHLPADFVIACKRGNKWYALPNPSTTLGTPAPVEIAVDDNDNPTIAYTATTNIYRLRGQDETGTYKLSSYGQWVKLGMPNNSNYPLFGSTSSQIKSDNNTNYTSNIGRQYWWELIQTNTSITNPQDAKYTIKSGNNSNPLILKENAGNPEWGLYGTGSVGPLRLIPASNIIFTEAYFVEWGQHGGIIEVDAQGIDATSVVAHLGANSSSATLTNAGTANKPSTTTKYNYIVDFGESIDFAATASNGALLMLDWKNGETVKAKTSLVVPKIIASNITINKSNYSQKTVWNTEVHVLPDKTVTIEADYPTPDITIKELNIYPGATVNVTTGTLKVKTLVLRNGWTRAESKKYDVARLYITPSTASIAKNAGDDVWYSEWYIDFDQYYPIAVPWEVDLNGNDGSKLKYKNTHSNAIIGPSGSVRLRYYDGASRAANGQTGVGSGANWKLYGDEGCTAIPAKLEPGKGYAMTARRPTGKAFSIIRMPMTFTNEWGALGEQGSVSSVHKDQLTVTAYGADAVPAKPTYLTGWNFIANPYMSLHQGALSYTEGGGSIMYANIPDINFKEYSQYPIATTKLKPSSGFLIQAPTDGTVTFATGNRKASAPGIRKDIPEETPEQQAFIVVSNENAKDMMGILVADQYTGTYEINADLQKLLGDGTSLKTYMHYRDLDMAYLAINKIFAQEWIPVSVRVPADGEYTFSMHEASIADELEGIYLIDYSNGDKITNLINEDYVFTAEAGTISNRFAINAKVGERETPTAVDVVNDGTIDPNVPIKFLYHEKVYILYQGVIYDATGKKVK